ncbi:MAG: Maf family protein [Pseudomonadota bacterium]|nr:Maf family protein [Pseudomonadota bacterium]
MNAKKKLLPKNNLWGIKQGFVLASGSPQRLRLLESAGFSPDAVITADIDETPLSDELPARYVRRIAIEKARTVAVKSPDKVILAADTVIAVGHRIIRKAAHEAEARMNLQLLSGRRHRVMTGFCIVMPDGREIAKVVQTAVIMKHLDEADLNAIIASGEWRGVAGYRIEGVLSACITKIIGSHPNIVGLPIFEVAQVLKGVLRHS